MSGYTPARKTAARAQRKTNVGRVIARGMASLGGAKAGRAIARARRTTARSGISSGPAKVVADPAGSDLPRGDLEIDAHGQPSAGAADSSHQLERSSWKPQSSGGLFAPGISLGAKSLHDVDARGACRRQP